MAKYNPFFEKAGMKKIKESSPNKHINQALTKLEELGFDVSLLASPSHIQHQIEQTGTQPIIDILTELSKHDSTIRRRIANTKTIYPNQKEFREKIQNINIKELAEALKKLSFCAQSKTYLFWAAKERYFA